MKKVLIILVILIAPFAVSAQDNTTSVPTESTIYVAPSSKEDVKTNTETAETKFKAEVNGLNYKKSIDIISIKAYRKSLQIKVKEVKLC